MNKIKSIKTFIIREGDTSVLQAYEERDQEGNITMLQSYGYEGELESKTEFSFDDKNRLAEEKQYTGDHLDQTITVNYNESGKPGTVLVDYADGSKSIKAYTRDETERITTINITDQDGDEEGKEVRKFDDEDRLLLEEIYNDFGNLESKLEYEYDEHGRVVESVEVDSEGFETVRFFDFYRNDKAEIIKIDILNEAEEIIRIDEFEIDERGNRTKHSMHNVERGGVYVDLRTFDENDNETRFERLMGDRPIEVVETKFRENGMMVEKETRRGDGVEVLRYEYELY